MNSTKVSIAKMIRTLTTLWNSEIPVSMNNFYKLTEYKLITYSEYLKKFDTDATKAAIDVVNNFLKKSKECKYIISDYSCSSYEELRIYVIELKFYNEIRSAKVIFNY